MNFAMSELNNLTDKIDFFLKTCQKIKSENDNLQEERSRLNQRSVKQSCKL